VRRASCLTPAPLEQERGCGSTVSFAAPASCREIGGLDFPLPTYRTSTFGRRSTTFAGGQEVLLVLPVRGSRWIPGCHPQIAGEHHHPDRMNTACRPHRQDLRFDRRLMNASYGDINQRGDSYDQADDARRSDDLLPSCNGRLLLCRRQPSESKFTVQPMPRLMAAEIPKGERT